MPRRPSTRATPPQTSPRGQAARGAQPPSPLFVYAGFWLRFVSNHVTGSFRQKIEAMDVSIAEWVVLRELALQPDLAPSQLAESLGVSRGGISKTVDKMESRGFLTRRASESDLRGQLLALTDAGRRLVPIIAAEAARNEQEWFGHLAPAELDRLKATLRQLVEHHQLRNLPMV
jgi:DNA-binding MarR family transcriptional regulator